MNRARLEIHCDETALDGITGKGVGVAVLDTGIYIHEDLKGKILGFKDFVHGKKFPYDDNGHGTHVSAMMQEAELLQGGYLKGLPREAGSLGSKCWTGKEMDMQQMC